MAGTNSAPTTATASALMRLFSGMSQVYGTYDVNSSREQDGKQVGKALTKRGEVTLQLWEDHLSGKQGIGIVPIRDDSSCLFGAIDVDEYKDVDHGRFARRISTAGLPLVVCRTKSGGTHLYCFAQKPIEAARMQHKLKEVAAFLGHGRSEVFPKQVKILAEQGDVGQWINMPYFNGIRGMRFAVAPNGDALSPDQFVELAESLRQPPDWFDHSLVLVDDFPEGPPCLQALSQLGYPAGTRNDGLYNIGVYLKKSDPDGWEAKLDDANHKFMSPPLGITEVQGVAKSLKRKDYGYSCTRQPICNHCNATLCRTRKHGVNAGGGKFPSLGGLTKIDTRPATWFWSIDGTRVELQTEELQDPRRFQRKVMDSLNLMPIVPAAPVWQAAVQHAMDSVTVISAPEESSQDGQFWEHVERFCTSRSQAMTKEEIVLGRPYTEGDKTFFRMQDLCSFLQRNKLSDAKPHKMVAILKEHGADHHASNLKGRTVNYWSIPAFEKQEEGFEVPKSLEEGRAPF